ncbi:MAG: cell division protein FtsZ [Lachnospiraceae bacterium]|jgi:cell division protein FtsZ|nr:cell division protein FtsZ [Lachnospiraceae bacterium]
MPEILLTNEKANAKILVIGVGGAGNNTVDRMISQNVTGVDYLCVNTDRQQLDRCLTANILQIGESITKGLGAGANPEVGKAAAEENKEDIVRALEDVDMVFITCGMGGGTGTGAAPVIAEVAKSAGILTVGAVTKPFKYEGTVRKRNAEGGIEELKKYVDTLIIVPNDKLLAISDRNTSFPQALEMADSVLQQGISGITDLIMKPGLINLDFADVKAVMTDKGMAHFGIGEAKGANKCIDAVKMAINSPLLETTLDHASHVIINYTGDVGLIEAGEATDYVQGIVGEDASIFFGSMPGEDMEDAVKVTLIATGLNPHESKLSFMKKAMESSVEKAMTRPVAPTENPAEKPAEQPMGIKIPEPVKPSRTLNNIELPNFLKK